MYMHTQALESKFEALGARLKVREVPSRWRQGDRTWISPRDFAMDIRRDGKGQFFELRVPTHLSQALDVTVMGRVRDQVIPPQRSLEGKAQLCWQPQINFQMSALAEALSGRWAL